MRGTFFEGWAAAPRLAASSSALTKSRKVIVINNVPLRCSEARRRGDAKASSLDPRSHASPFTPTIHCRPVRKKYP